MAKPQQQHKSANGSQVKSAHGIFLGNATSGKEKPEKADFEVGQ